LHLQVLGHHLITLKIEGILGILGSSHSSTLRGMDERERLERWICQICRKRYVVPDLARGCEEKHLEEEYA
jgi:hypothetical protein